ncbi:sugar ABC transporter substrate-binding protein [Streptomyces bungoensis]|uniref:sugar ABC transporter substrate-binding protein n=1 Tax=Streptomyces bungoensis TaxID=285568 RepID=UPI0033F5474D
MRRRTRHLLAALAAGLMALPAAACAGTERTGADSFTVGVLLPSRILPRWEHADRPLIEKRVKELCPRCAVEYANADDDPARQRQQMTSMITKGVKVIVLDAADTRALRSSIRDAHRSGVPVVAYDRLAEGPVSGFVSFDGGQVGRLQGRALLTAMGDRARGGRIVMMNGDLGDPNAAWFRQGALSVLTGRVRIARSYDTPGWSTDNAHAAMAAAIAALGPRGIDGALAANDAIAAGVVSALKSAGVRRLPPVTGQDADLEAVQRIVKGEQTMTVYKPFRLEAAAAAEMAVALARGGRPGGAATTTVDSPTTRHIPARLLTPREVTAATVRQTLVKDGVYTVAQICTRAVRPACDRAGLDAGGP